MSRAALLFAACAVASGPTDALAAGADGVQLLLLSTPGTTPPAATVQGVVEEQLESFRVWVELLEREATPADGDEWGDVATDAARQRPGMLALVGWSCSRRRCRAYVAEPRSGAVVEIPVARAADDQQTARALAAVIREVVLGRLLPELERLAEEGQQPSEPPDIFGQDPSATSETEAAAGTPRPWLWLEGGYHGEYPYPGERALHGPWIGLSAAPTRHLLSRLAVGWLGVQRGENDLGDVMTHRLPILLGLGLALPVGQATASLMPAARLDIVFARSERHAPPAEQRSATDPELHVGGTAGWNLPLPRGLEIVLGVGAYATVVSRSYEVGEIEALPRSKLRVVWSAGVAWSPVR
jgi:hypothetical protein